jgi:hypothetical protein
MKAGEYVRALQVRIPSGFTRPRQSGVTGCALGLAFSLCHSCRARTPHGNRQLNQHTHIHTHYSAGAVCAERGRRHRLGAAARQQRRRSAVSQNGQPLSRRGRSLPAKSSGVDTHHDSISSRFDCRCFGRWLAKDAMAVCCRCIILWGAVFRACTGPPCLGSLCERAATQSLTAVSPNAFSPNAFSPHRSRVTTTPPGDDQAPSRCPRGAGPRHGAEEGTARRFLAAAVRAGTGAGGGPPHPAASW